MRIVEDSFLSRMLSKRIKYHILYSKNFTDSKKGKDHPVLYLLHGLFGESKNWMELTEISGAIKALPFSVISFDAGNSWYSDSVKGNGANYESFFINEFVPFVENENKLGGSKSNRAIAGLSMGGYGALKFALKYPSMFIWAGSMSGAFDAPRQTENRPGPDWEILKDSINEVFGEIQHNYSRNENDLFQIVDEIKNNDLEKLPKIYFDCGIEDSFIDVNRELFEKLKDRKILCDFYENPGGHDWFYWNRQLLKMLLIVERVFS